MIKLRRRLAALVVLLFILLTPAEVIASSKPSSAKPADSISSWDENNPGSLRDSHLYGQSAILIDARTGETLYEKSPDRLMYPASTTKVLTALIALEKGDMSDVLTASHKAAATEATYIPVKEGEKFSLKDLLYALMLISANDAAVVIAEHYGGSTDGFAEMMNQRANALGCVDSNFVTANGLPDANHYTTVADMAKIVRAAMQNDTFREIVSAPSYTIGPTNKTENSRKQNNKNKMLPTSEDMFSYEWCLGGKTGYTKAAQHTYVAAAEKDGVSLICVIFGTTPDGKWLDAKKLFEYGFSQYASIDIPALYAAYPASCDVDNSDDGDSGILRLDIENPEALSGIIGKKDVVKNIEANFSEYHNIYYPEIVTAPIETGQKVGELSIRISEESEPILVNLVASRKVDAKPAAELSADMNASLAANGIPPTFEQIAQNASNSPIRYMALLLLLPVILLIGLIISMALEMNRRRRRRNRPRGTYSSSGDMATPLRRRY